ncbi:MAG TPA: FAD-dependent oxidoreductase [Vicinamibacteria bacterium]|nr:FAD-dependent oxidoreductase [Vicinamibacteria bacterium]
MSGARLVVLAAVLLAGTGGGVRAQARLDTDVLVVGGGTGGTAAALQSARLGARTIVAEPTPWLGGMLSAAGVSATDGNHRLPSGIWREFRQRIYDAYGGPEAVATGWVSNTHFEPHVADRVFKEMAAAEPSLRVLLRHRFVDVLKEGGRVRGAVLEDLATNRRVEARAKVVVDGTDLGDVLARAGAAFDLGLEADSVSGENAGISASSDVVQDLTWCAILKDYRSGADRTVPRPEGYDPGEFDCSSTSYCRDATREKPTVDARKMLAYAKLPGGKYLINWPNHGNDTYLNVVGFDDAARERALENAKARTLRFVYFIQHELGFRTLGLADDEYPTKDRLPLIPYHREGRRLRGVVRFTARDIAEPFGPRDPLFRTGISVGDYPIDHHHKRNPQAPQHLWFVPVPSFSVPLGALIPETVDGLLVADKAISVSNVANGTTRLQPVVLLTGQAAGTLAALAARLGREPRSVPVRDVQRSLLEARAFLLPYLDVPPEHPQFARIQRVGATGILKGKGVAHQWANQTWFYPDFPIDAATLHKGLAEFEKVEGPPADGRPLTVGEALKMLTDYREALLKKDKARFAALEGQEPRPGTELCPALGLGAWEPDRRITRAELAALVDELLDPFTLKPVDHRGRFAE